MSLLQQNSPELDDAARGEEFTKGSSNALLASVVAAVLVSIAIFLYVKLGEKPAPATGEVTNVTAHLMHRQTAAFDAAGAAMPQDTFDQILLFAHMKLNNQTKQPLFLHQIIANLALSDGIHSSYAAVPTDYERAFQGFPEISAFHGKALATETTLNPGQSVEGDVLFSFRMGKQEWDARKGMDFTLAFRYQPLVRLTPTGPITDR